MSKQMNTPATTLADIKPLVKKLHLSRMMERLEELYADPSVQDLTPIVNFQRFPTLDAKKLVNAPKMSAHHRGICHF